MTVYTVMPILYIRSGNRDRVKLFYNTRRVKQGMFRLPKVNKAIFSDSLLYLGSKNFNQLPERLREF